MQKIAIIGSGISGLGAAYLLQQRYAVTLYEKEPRLGGHARTVDVRYGDETIAVDTGFIVFNYRNYPHLTAMFKHLDVPVKPSDMSLGLSVEGGKFEWGCQGLNAIFGQRSNLFSPRFWWMLRDILRFNKAAPAYKSSDITLGQLLQQLGMGSDFCHRFLLPTAGAIWSSSPEQILAFPAASFITFFEQHGLLTVNDQPKWWTVDGGSRQYVQRIQQQLTGQVRLSSPVQSVVREAGKVNITANGITDSYDHVIFATHSDQALRLLNDATEAEQRILSHIPYQNNYAYLHRDPALMPKRKAVWASWNYLCDHAVDENARITVTYWMNRLQSIPSEKRLFVTLNPARPPRADLIDDEVIFEHPVYNQAMREAQLALPTVQGQQNTWFCGAYTRYGFHEDGLHSAVNVAEQLGVKVPW
jgi:predicted NAD/FAD-binding protein